MTKARPEEEKKRNIAQDSFTPASFFPPPFGAGDRCARIFLSTFSTARENASVMPSLSPSSFPPPLSPFLSSIFLSFSHTRQIYADAKGAGGEGG